MLKNMRLWMRTRLESLGPTAIFVATVVVGSVLAPGRSLAAPTARSGWNALVDPIGLALRGERRFSFPAQFLHAGAYRREVVGGTTPVSVSLPIPLVECGTQWSAGQRDRIVRPSIFEGKSRSALDPSHQRRAARRRQPGTAERRRRCCEIHKVPGSGPARSSGGPFPLTFAQQILLGSPH